MQRTASTNCFLGRVSVLLEPSDSVASLEAECGDDQAVDKETFQTMKRCSRNRPDYQARHATLFEVYWTSVVYVSLNRYTLSLFHLNGTSGCLYRDIVLSV